MGSMDGNPRKSSQNRSFQLTKLKIALLVVSTNIISVSLFSGSSSNLKWSVPAGQLWDSEHLLQKLNATENKFTAGQEQIMELQKRLAVSNSLLESLLKELGQAHGDKAQHGEFDEWLQEQSEELKLAMGPHKLPFGYTSNLGSDELYPTLGTACKQFPDELAQFLKYNVGGECPSDDIFAQKLMLKGCEPLPRRRCHPKAPVNYVEPHPFPQSLWSIPPDTSIVWDPYTCKNYTCLVNRNKMAGSYDCKDCFDLFGREKDRWLENNGNLGYAIDEVLAIKPGTIRIGLDIGGGSGSFAARMRERNVTIVTSSMNFDGPFNSFIASRGLVSMHISVAHRLPFFENTLDIVHSMHVLSNWIPDIMLEFALYDIYRVLRPGGLFWLDHFFCIGAQLNSTYVPMFDSIGFKKVKWNVGRKLDRGFEKDEWYFSALLEKPMS